MNRHNKTLPTNSHSLFYKKIKHFSLCLLILCFISFSGRAQDKAVKDKYTVPSWWFGAAAGANYNRFSGSFRRVNEVTFVPAPFGKGRGAGIFGALSLEYHKPGSMFAIMLQEGIDDRSAHFDLQWQRLETHIAYVTVEPSLKVFPLKKSGLYLYGGPRIGFLITTDFVYKRAGLPDYPDNMAKPDDKFYISSVRKNPLGVQAGLGYDLYLSGKGKKQQVVLSPFASYFPTLWRKNLRTIETLYLNTIRAGITLKTGSGKKIIPPVVLPPAPPIVTETDRDYDGIPDLNDRCPDSAGVAALQGCPDRDGDGIANIDDKCPDVFGYARYQGCPIPDTDGDGINDEEDKCPTRPGPISNKGCPTIAKEVVDKINFAARNIFFATGSYKLLPKSYAGLDGVVNLLKVDETLMIDIDGHTDSQGTDENNQVLSENRAAAIKNYMTGKGIDAGRLTTKGYGESRPVETNNTAEGRAMNRRTEMNVRNF